MTNQKSGRVIGAVAIRRRRWFYGATGIAALIAAAIAFSGAAEAAATAWVGDQHAEARLVTAVEATGSAHLSRG